MDDPLARQALNRVVAQRTLLLKELLRTMEPAAFASGSIEDAARAVLESVLLTPLVLDVAALVGPERTENGAWLWAAPLKGPSALTACLPSRWFVLSPPGADGGDPPCLVFIYDDRDMLEDEAWRLFQGDWRDALAWIAGVDAVVARAGRRWRAVATRDITTRRGTGGRPSALTSPHDNS